MRVKGTENALWESKIAQGRPVVRLQHLPTGPDRACRDGARTSACRALIHLHEPTPATHTAVCLFTTAHQPSHDPSSSVNLVPSNTIWRTCAQGLCGRSPRPVNGWPARDSCTQPAAHRKPGEASHQTRHPGLVRDGCTQAPVAGRWPRPNRCGGAAAAHHPQQNSSSDCSRCRTMLLDDRPWPETC